MRIFLFSILLLAFSPSFFAADVKPAPKKKIKVITHLVEPFSIYKVKEKSYTGFSIDLWYAVAEKAGFEYKMSHAKSFKDLFSILWGGDADLAIGAITMTADREKDFDFTFSTLNSGFMIMVTKTRNEPLEDFFVTAADIIFSKGMLTIITIFFIVLMISSHIIWFFERHHNPDFPKTYLRGIFESFWWAAVTITTVGYGDKTPRGTIGKFFGLFWMLAGVFIITYFTAGVTAALTHRKIVDDIENPSDLVNKKVASVSGTTAGEFLSRQNLRHKLYPSINEAYMALETEKVAAIVYDAPILLYHASHLGRHKFKVVGEIFHQENYGFMMPENSKLLKDINFVLLQLKENGVYQNIYNKWFGQYEQ